MNADKKLSEVTRGKYVSSRVAGVRRKACLRKASANYLRKKK